MVNYTQKDVRITVSGQDIFCDSVDLKLDSSVNPNFNTLSKNSYEFSAGGPVKGTVSISYFVTGGDFLINNVTNEREPVAINFNGLQLNSGYLSSYSFSAESFTPLQVSANFNFYCPVTGTFAPAAQELSSVPPLNISDMSLDNGTLITTQNIKSLSYNYQSDIFPNYVVDENYDPLTSAASSVTSSAKRIDVSFSLYDYDLSMPASGQRQSFKFNFKDKNGSSKQTYYVDGQITSKQLGARTRDRVISNYSLNQGLIGGESSSILNISPTGASPSELVLVSGTNLDEVENAYIGEYPCNISGEIKPTGFRLVVPNDILSGYLSPVKLTTKAGEVIGDQTFNAYSGLTYF